MSEKILNFFTIIAWVFGIIGTLVTIAAVYLNITYEGSADHWRDRMKGRTRTYRFGWWFVISVLCWTFIIVF